MWKKGEGVGSVLPLPETLTVPWWLRLQAGASIFSSLDALAAASPYMVGRRAARKAAWDSLELCIPEFTTSFLLGVSRI